MPVITDDGTVWAMTNTGEGFAFNSSDPIKGRPVISILDAEQKSCQGQGYCNVSQLGAIVRTQGTQRMAFIPTGAGVLVFTQQQGAKSWTLDLQTSAGLLQCPSWGNRFPAIGRDGTIYLSLENVFDFSKVHFGVCAIGPTGMLKWKSPQATSWTTSPVIGSDDVMYFGSNDQRVYAVDLADPSQFKWTFPTGGGTTSPAVGVDNTLYFGSADENLYAVEGSNGSLKWLLQVDGAITGSPIIDGDGTIFFGTQNDYFYAVNPNGTVRFRTFTGSPIGESAAIDANGTVYFGTTDGFVFSIAP
jgi:outer membrane protein assembly factor BamB